MLYVFFFVCHQLSLFLFLASALVFPWISPKRFCGVFFLPFSDIVIFENITTTKMMTLRWQATLRSQKKNIRIHVKLTILQVKDKNSVAHKNGHIACQDGGKKAETKAVCIKCTRLFTCSHVCCIVIPCPIHSFPSHLHRKSLSAHITYNVGLLGVSWQTA